jgi:hypothetical protein
MRAAPMQARHANADLGPSRQRRPMTNRLTQALTRVLLRCYNLTYTIRNIRCILCNVGGHRCRMESMTAP